MTGFLTTIETVATNIEQDVVSGLKAGLNYVDNVVVQDIEPELLPALLKAIETFGSVVLGDLLGQLTPGATVTVPAAS